MMIDFGRYVTAHALRAARRWPSQVRIAVNVSPTEFGNVELASEITRLLESNGVDPKRLELEITEQSLFADEERALKLVKRLKALGISIAIDDFGTGYSSLSLLQRFPVDRIKIDKSFISQINQDTDSDQIVRSIIGLSKNLGIDVLAEGIETQNQMSFLEQHGCNTIQGYLIGKPVPFSDVGMFLGAEYPPSVKAA